MKNLLISTCTLLVLLSLFCVLPVDPAKNPSNASAKFTTINNADPVSLNEVIAGATVTLGYNLSLPDFIDSVKVTIVSSQQAIERTYIIKAPWEAETLSIPVIFPSAGTKTCVLMCFRSNGTTSDAQLIFVVAYQPGNHPPKWSPDTVELTSQKGLPETRSLLPYAKDPDEKPLSFTIAPPGSQFIVQDSRISATASIDTGRYFISVIISDGEMQDTGIVAWKVFVLQTMHAVVMNDSATTVIDSQITIDVLVNDLPASGTMLLSAVTQPENGLVVIKNNKAVYIPASGFSGTDTFNYIVNGIDTGKVSVRVAQVTAATVIDIIPPALRLTIPQIDSATVNASSATISIEATDTSGIASVTASFGVADLIVSAAATVYSVTVTNLPANQFTIVRFIATDASDSGNKDTLYVSIKYDPSISDATGPVFKQISGPASGSIITNPLVTIVDSITDPSGIDSVFWSLNNSPVKSLTAIAGKPDQFSLTATVERENLDTIIITAVDKSAKRNRSTRVVVLKYVVAPVISAQSSSQTVCAGTPVTFTVAATGTSPLSYQWRKGPEENLTDIPGAIGASYGFTPGAADNGSIYSCIVNNGSNVTAVSAPITLTVNSASTKPAAVATPATICTGESSTLSVSAGTLGSGASWKWYTAKSSTTALTSLTVSPTSSKWYYVKGTGGLCGDSPWDSAYVTVNSQSIVPTSITASVAAVCSGGSVTLTQTGGTLGTGATTWQWFTDSACTQPATGIPNADGSQITVSPTSNTTYYVKATGICNSTTAMNKAVTVNTPSTPPTGINSATTSVCPGSSIVLTVSGGSLGTGAAWKWYTNSTCTQAASGTPGNGGSQFTVLPSVKTTYYVRAEGGCSNTPSANTTVSVNTPPVISVPLNNMENCAPGESDTYSIYATGSTPFSYRWYKTDGTALDPTQTLSFSPQTIGTTSIYCIVTDVNGCSTSSNTATITVHKATSISRQPKQINGGYYVLPMADTVAASGEGTLVYQWQYQLPNFSWEIFATGPILSIVPSETFTAYSSHWGTGETIIIPVRVRITNSFGCEVFTDNVQVSLMCDI